jgi:hypothetical protein
MTEIPGCKLQVFEYCAKVPPDDFAKVIKSIADWYNEAYVIVECNSIGLVTTISNLDSTIASEEDLCVDTTWVTGLWCDWNWCLWCNRNCLRALWLYWLRCWVVLW